MVVVNQKLITRVHHISDPLFICISHFHRFVFNKQRPSLALHVEDTPFDVRQVGNSETKVMLETKRGGRWALGILKRLTFVEWTWN